MIDATDRQGMLFGTISQFDVPPAMRILAQRNYSAADLHTANPEKFNKCREGKKTMQRIVAKLFIGVAITAVGLLGADNSLGTWKRNVAKSKTSAPSKNPVKSLTQVREASDGGVKVTTTGEYMDGTPINGSFTAKYDGKEYPVTGAPWDTISIKQIDANTFTSEVKKAGGKYHSKGRTVISKDGKTMTLTNKGTNAEGKAFTGTVVYDKQ
jgi:hypothetical protein